MRFQKFFEFNQKDLEPIKSFYIKDELNSKLWSDFKLDQDVRENLLTIARDFFETLDTECEVKDIALCGSLCNYNWSEKYSDYDLHIIIDFRDIDENVELVEKFCDYAKKQWNSNHDITLKGYEVEVAIQDEKDLKQGISSGRMGGVFSLMKNKWIKKPEKVEFIPDDIQYKNHKTILYKSVGLFMFYLITKKIRSKIPNAELDALYYSKPYFFIKNTMDVDPCLIYL